MKILIDANVGIVGFGLTNAFRSLKHQCVLWESTTKPAFDVFAELEPEVFLGTQTSLQDRATKKNLDKRTQLKALIFDEPALWELLAFDSILYKEGVVKEKYVCDVMYAGGPEPWMEPYFAALAKKKVHFRVYSSQDWGSFAQHVGALEINELADAYVSARFCLNMAQTPNENAYRISGCGGNCINVCFGDKIPCLALMPSVDAVVGFIMTYKDKLLDTGSVSFPKKTILKYYTYLNRATKLLEVIEGKNEKN